MAGDIGAGSLVDAPGIPHQPAALPRSTWPMVAVDRAAQASGLAALADPDDPGRHVQRIDAVRLYGGADHPDLVGPDAGAADRARLAGARIPAPAGAHLSDSDDHYGDPADRVLCAKP